MCGAIPVATLPASGLRDTLKRFCLRLKIGDMAYHVRERILTRAMWEWEWVYPECANVCGNSVGRWK